MVVIKHPLVIKQPLQAVIDGEPIFVFAQVKLVMQELELACPNWVLNLHYDIATLRHWVNKGGLIYPRQTLPIADQYLGHAILELGQIGKDLLVKFLQCILRSSQEGNFNEAGISECAANLTGFIKVAHLFIFTRLLNGDAIGLTEVMNSSSLQLYSFLTNYLSDPLVYNTHLLVCHKLLYFFSKLEVICEPEQCRALYQLCCHNSSIVEKIIDIMS